MIRVAGAFVSIFLTQGGFIVGPGWEERDRFLERDRYEVSVAQNPNRSLVKDAAFTTRDIGAQTGPVARIGYSYGPTVIIEAGAHRKVSALVSIDFPPDW